MQFILDTTFILLYLRTVFNHFHKCLISCISQVMLISIRSTLKEKKYSFKYIYIISTSNFFLRDTISFLERVNKTRVTCQLFGSVFLLLVQSMWTNSKWPAQHCRLLYQHCHRQLQPNWRKPAKTTDTVLSKVINIYITKFFLETSDRS